MFSGIVEDVGTVRYVGPHRDGTEGIELCIETDITRDGTEIGDSIAVGGVCLTVTSFDDEGFTVGLSPETLRRTVLGRLEGGAPINLERSLPVGGRFHGHVVQGHVDGVATITGIRPEGDALWMTFTALDDILRYVVFKGYIAINGVSLTVAALEPSGFAVQLVDYTRGHVDLGDAWVGMSVNVEVDVMAKYVEQLLAPTASLSEQSA